MVYLIPALLGRMDLITELCRSHSTNQNLYQFFALKVFFGFYSSLCLTLCFWYRERLFYLFMD